jgi:hypothetical protein
VYPLLQAKLAVAPKVVAGRLTVPFAGLASGPQLTIGQAGAVPLHAPLEEQVRVAVPVRVYPVLQA